MIPVLLLLGVVVLRHEPRLSGTNALVAISGRALTINPGAALCHLRDVPAGTARARVFSAPQWISTGGPLAIEITPPRGVGVKATGPTFSGDGPVDIELLRPLAQTVEGAEVCVNNRGPTPVQVAGNQTPPRFSPANLSGQIFDDAVRVDFYRPGEESYVEFAPEVATRFGLVKASFFGDWTLWLFFAGLAVIWASTLSWVWFKLRSV